MHVELYQNGNVLETMEVRLTFAIIKMTRALQIQSMVTVVITLVAVPHDQ